MFGNKTELLDKIRLGEDALLELKEVRFAGQRVSAPHRDSIADELVAFANSRGGVCVLGVADKTREIRGVPDDRTGIVETMVHELCYDSIKPSLAPHIEWLRLPAPSGAEVAVLKIDVPRSLFVHQGPGGYLHRVGSSKREMSPAYLARLFQRRDQTRLTRFDEQIVADAELKDLAPEFWERFKTPRTGADPDDLLSKLRLARRNDDGGLKPTVAGVLMASQDPRRWLPNAFVQAVAYRGEEIRTDDPSFPYQLDAADIIGPLDKQVEAACQFVAKNMRMAAFKSSEYMGRRDRPQFDLTAVFEALVNAVAHRDYSIYGAKIRLRLFENRLELYSPGGIPNTLSVENLPYVQTARNEILASLLARCPVPADKPWLTTDRQTLMDRRGEGVRIIMENSERLSGRAPEYRLIDDAELLLTIYAPTDSTTD